MVDGLILVDLTQTDPRVLERYLGRQGVTTFLAQQQPLLPRQVLCGTGNVLGKHGILGK